MRCIKIRTKQNFLFYQHLNVGKFHKSKILRQKAEQIVFLSNTTMDHIQSNEQSIDAVGHFHPQSLPQSFTTSWIDISLGNLRVILILHI